MYWKLWEAVGERLRMSLPKWGAVYTAQTATVRSKTREQPRSVSASSAPGLCGLRAMRTPAANPHIRVLAPLCQEVELVTLGQVYFPTAECQYFHLFQSCPGLFKFFFHIERENVTEFLEGLVLSQNSKGKSYSFLTFQGRKSGTSLTSFEN